MSFQVDATTLEFEDHLLKVLQSREDYPEGLDSRANVQRRYTSQRPPEELPKSLLTIPVLEMFPVELCGTMCSCLLWASF